MNNRLNTENIPEVSILMSCYNGSRWLSEAIESILIQTYKSFELLLVNDGSTDDTWNIIQFYKNLDNRIIAINKKNTGLADSLNLGINMARGRWIVRIDQDDICDTKRLEQQINFLYKNPLVVLLGSGFVEIDDKNRILKKHKYPSQHNKLVRCLEKSKRFFPHSSACYRLDIVKEIGGYNTRIRRAEDRDLWLKFATKGKIACMSNYLVSIRKHSNQMSLENNGQNQFCDAISSEVCYWLRKYGYQDPSTCSNIIVWKKFHCWIEHRIEDLGVFNNRKAWSLARVEYFSKKNRFISTLAFIIKLIQNQNSIGLIWEKIFGSNISKRLAIEWMKNNILK